jgi:hypothetical protein
MLCLSFKISDKKKGVLETPFDEFYNLAIYNISPILILVRKLGAQPETPLLSHCYLIFYKFV